MKTRIVKRESTTWEDHKQICLLHVEYKLQYQKSFMNFKYWRDFKDGICFGYDPTISTTSRNTIWMEDKQKLIERFNCLMNKTITSYE